jgi:hypothetical protein
LNLGSCSSLSTARLETLSLDLEAAERRGASLAAVNARLSDELTAARADAQREIHARERLAAMKMERDAEVAGLRARLVEAEQFCDFFFFFFFFFFWVSHPALTSASSSLHTHTHTHTQKVHE